MEFIITCNGKRTTIKAANCEDAARKFVNNKKLVIKRTTGTFRKTGYFQTYHSLNGDLTSSGYPFHVF